MKKRVEQDEHYWIEAFQRGNEQALSYYFDLYYQALRYFACRLIHDQDEAEDIVADCFTKLWQGDRQLRNEQNIKAFLYISCKNACFNYLKRLKARTLVQEKYLQELEQNEDSVLNKIIKTEVLEIIAREIETLPEKCRDVFKLIYFGHKKTEEIAIQLGISAKTVRNHKAKAITLLKASVLKKDLSDVILMACIYLLEKK